MNITEITTRAGARPNRKRVGRGEGSGTGKTSGRGHKGEGSRSGGLKGGMYEGGVFPLFRRVPKVGFNNANFRKEYQVVNVCDLEKRFKDGDHVTAATLSEIGLIRDEKKPVKILGDGELKRKLTVEAQRFSATAVSIIEKAGGTIKKLGPQPKKKFVKRPAPPKPKVEAVEAVEKKAGEKSAEKAPDKKKSKKSGEGESAGS